MSEMTREELVGTTIENGYATILDARRLDGDGPGFLILIRVAKPALGTGGAFATCWLDAATMRSYSAHHFETLTEAEADFGRRNTPVLTGTES